MSSEFKNIPILHLNTARTWRGGEKQTFYLSLYLQRWGYSSYVICQEDSALSHRLRDMSLPLYPLRMSSELDIFSALKIARIIKQIKPGILHMHTAHAQTLGMIGNFFARVPANVVSRRVDFRVGKNVFSRIKYQFPDIFIAVSDAVRNILIEDGVPGEKAVTVHSGVVLDSYGKIKTDYLADEFGNSYSLEGKVKLVNVAALTPQKDHATLIRAMDFLVKSDKGFILFIVGDGELEKSLLELRDRLGLQDHIIFTGFRDDAINFIKFSDIFILSSRWEGLGTSIIDAMALEKPVIATDTGGIPELIDDRKTGILVEKENPEQLAKAILKLINDRSLKEKISEHAAQRVKDFSIEKTVSRTIEVYKKLLRNL